MSVHLGWKARLRYRFDTQLSKGAWIVILWLGAVAVALVTAAGAVDAFFHVGLNNGKPVGFLEAFWQDLLRLLDTGTMAGDNGLLLRSVSLLVTVSGIFVATSLIGLVAAGLDQRIASLRRGRSAVIEKGHTLVLGWSPRVQAVVAELVVANQNHRGQVVVVLAAEDKMLMEDRLRASIASFGTTKLVCRTGDPASPHDLALVNAHGARAIIVLAGETSDSSAVKAVLAVMTGPDEGQRPPMVVEMRDGRNARALAEAADEGVLTVEPDDVIAKVTAQACHQPGMGVVYRELLDFEGVEIYFASAPELVGHSFGEALLAYEASAVIGRARPDGTIELNPPMDSLFTAGDSVIAISADDDTVIFSGFSAVEAPPSTGIELHPAASQHVLIVGWSTLGERILRELDRLLNRGTPVDVLVDDSLQGSREVSCAAVSNLEVTFHSTDNEPARLREMLATSGYEHVVVLAYRDGLTAPDADARTLLTLLTLRRAARHSSAPPRVVAEVVESRNVPLAETAGADDLVVSDRLASLLIAQLAENPSVRGVLDELFGPDGASIELHPAGAYLSAGSCPFATSVAAARARGCAAIGYRCADGQVVVNPSKRDMAELGAGDQLIVLAGSALTTQG